jgi:hypothetical protein
MLHGLTRSTVVQARVEVAGDALTATGSFVIRHTDFGLTPVSVAGVVKVKNEIAIDYKIQAAVRTASGGLSVPPRGEGQGFERELRSGIAAHVEPAHLSTEDPKSDAAVRQLRDEWVLLWGLAVAMLAGMGMPTWMGVLRPRKTDGRPGGCSPNGVTP